MEVSRFDLPLAGITLLRTLLALGVTMGSNRGYQLRVARPRGTRFEHPVVLMLSPSSLRRGWARPVEASEIELLRRNARVLARLMATAPAGC
jgi:hypothetical protein